MPTRDVLESFWRDWADLSPQQKEAFRRAVAKLVDDLRARRGIRAGLRVKRVQGVPGIYELTWAPDGRATFSYGRSLAEDEPHVIWRRIGTHDVLRKP
jgi:hypothetical protein